ncbi:MerC domain-containing protein [Spongorhabdus nitratireducens]
MKALQTYTDKAAIGLSFLCLAHCLALPLILVMLPSLTVLNLENELFHLGMVVIVVPTSLYALTLGCKKHKNYQLLGIGLAGLAFLLAAVIGEEMVGEFGEKALTMMGSLLIAYGHFRNYQLCRHAEDCSCAEQCIDT